MSLENAQVRKIKKVLGYKIYFEKINHQKRVNFTQLKFLGNGKKLQANKKY